MNPLLSSCTLHPSSPFVSAKIVLGLFWFISVWIDWPWTSVCSFSSLCFNHLVSSTVNLANELCSAAAFILNLVFHLCWWFFNLQFFTIYNTHSRKEGKRLLFSLISLVQHSTSIPGPVAGFPSASQPPHHCCASITGASNEQKGGEPGQLENSEILSERDQIDTSNS